jgi:hypothetical protein
VYVALVVAWTWPLAADPLGLDLARNTDGPNTLGMAAASLHLDAHGRSMLLAWPEGQSFARGDSFVYFLLARVCAAAPPATVVALVTLAGPVLSALAASYLARTLGARDPWAWLAGMAYAFSGVMATAILDGYAFNVLDPWMPLAVAYAWRACTPGGRIRDGIAAAVAWALTLGTSAYAGIGATVLIVALGLDGARRRLPDAGWRAGRGGLVALLGGCLASGGAYAAMFAAAPESARRGEAPLATTITMMETGSARLGTLLWRAPVTDALLHTQGALLGTTAAVLALLLVLPRRDGGVRAPGLTALGGAAVLLLLAAFGPRLRLFLVDPGTPWVLASLARAGAGTFLRFPERLLLPVTLVSGTLGAVVLTRISSAGPRRAALLLAAGALDVLVGSGVSLRASHLPWSVPGAYAAAPPARAVLDLWPRMVGASAVGEDLRIARRVVGYAAFHRRPVLASGLAIWTSEDARRPVSDWLTAHALAASDPVHGAEGGTPSATPPPPDGPAVRATLDALGIGAVALHAQLYPPRVLAGIEDGLEALLGPVTSTSHDGGETILLWKVSDTPLRTSPQERAATLRTLTAEAP